ncbi:helix-turn-helix domain-containing protein [Williamsia sp. SKLECPSW1]
MSGFGGDGASRSVISALELIEEVAASGPGVSANDLARSLGLPRSTTYRLVNLLAQEEYLVRTPDLGGFALGRKVDRLIGTATATTVPDRVRSVLDEARAGMRFGLHLFGYLRVGTPRARITPMDLDPDYPLSDASRILRDHRVSAVGRLLLAHDSGHRSQQLVPATQVGSLTPGFGCVAVPIVCSDGTLRGALAIAAPEHRVRNPDALIASVESTRDALCDLIGTTA